MLIQDPLRQRIGNIRRDPAQRTAFLTDFGINREGETGQPAHHAGSPYAAETAAMNDLALGLAEARGFVGVARVVDAVVKAAPVTVAKYHKVGGGLVLVCLQGGLSAVKYAIDAIPERASPRQIAVAVLPAPSPAVLVLLGLQQAGSAGEHLAEIDASVSMGLLETKGLLPLTVALDAMVKSAHVVFAGHELAGDGLVTACVLGDIASVQHAIEVGAREASRVGEILSTHLIANPQGRVADALAGITHRQQVSAEPAFPPLFPRRRPRLPTAGPS